MGITIAYRGRLADLTRVEDFEDRILDLALEFGGQAQVWRSSSEGEPRRVVRGVLLDLVPGLETTSLLLSPEGWLIGLTDIENAENGRLTAPPWCFTKTQFGPLEGHVALIETFAALQREFLADLELSDEGGYHPTRDLAELSRRRAGVQQAIDGMAEGLARHGLSREAAEDPDILVHRIERIAAQVHRILRRPAEHPPVTFPEGEDAGVQDPEATEALWDQMFKHTRRQQERLRRAIEEQQSRGEADDTTIENVLRQLGLELPDEDSPEEAEPWCEELASFAEPDEAGSWESDEQENPFEQEEERHPLLERAMDLLKHLHVVFGEAEERYVVSLRTLFEGADHVLGGLAQSLGGREEADADYYGLRVVQMKRALRGAAFARGALLSLRAAVSAQRFDELHRTLKELEKDVFDELGRLRSERRGDDA